MQDYWITAALAAAVVAVLVGLCVRRRYAKPKTPPPTPPPSPATLERRAQAAAIQNGEYLLSFLRRRVNDVLLREGYAPSFSRADYDRTPPRSPHAPRIGVIDPVTRFFRRGEYSSDAKGRIAAADATAEFIIGMTLKEMQISGVGWASRVHPDDFRRVIAAWMTAHGPHHTVVYKLRYKHPYHVKYACAISNPVFDENGLFTAHRGYMWQVDKDTYEMIQLPG